MTKNARSVNPALFPPFGFCLFDHLFNLFRFFSVILFHLFFAFLFGLAFALGLTPCVGAFLAAALATAAESGHALKGAALLGVYSAGLGIPFIVAGIALAKMNGLFKRIKSSYNVLVPVCGVALILFGVWMVAKPWVKVGVSSSSSRAEDSFLQL